MSDYTPGVCNINPKETAKRHNFGWAMVIVAIGLLILLLSIKASLWWGISLAAPGTLAAVGLLQARQKFCIALAVSGVQHAGEKPTTTKAKDRELDLQRSTKLFVTAVFYGVVFGITGLAIMSILNPATSF